MENDYSNLEHLVQDVTSLDTARMTLRWALERVSALDHATRDLEKQLRESRERQAVAERRARELDEQVSSKLKLLSEREAFYHKLEEMISELSEGKVDLGAIAQREAEVDKERLRLEAEYRKKAEDLDRSQREFTAQWMERLRRAEAYEPQKLSETLQKYDEYRRQLEQAYQARLLALDQSFHKKEELLLQRESELESISSEKLEQARRLADMQKAWGWERERLLEEKTGLERSLQSATAKVEQFQSGLLSAENKYWEASRQWSAEREQLTKDKLEAIRRVQEESRASLEEKLRQTQAAGDLRLEETEKEFGDRLLRVEEEWANKARLLEARREAERKDFQDATAHLERLLQEAHAQVQSLRDAMVRQKADIEAQATQRLAVAEQAHRQLLEQEGRRSAEDIRVREGEILRLREMLQAARGELANADTEAQNALEVQKKALEEDFARRRNTLAQSWEVERNRLAEDIVGRDQQFTRAQAEIAELHKLVDETRKAAESEANAKLAGYHEENEKRLQALQQIWRDEKDALIKQIERRVDVIQALRDHLITVEEQLAQAAVHEQQVLGDEQTRLLEEFQKTLATREGEESGRREALAKAWEAERSRLQSQWTAALEDLRSKGETIAELQRSLAEKSALTQTRDEMLAQFEGMKADLQDQYEKRIKAFESSVHENQKTLEARWLAERGRLVDDLAARDKKFDDAQTEIERLHQDVERQKATERARTREALAKEQQEKILALEKAAEAEKQALLGQIDRKEAAIDELKDRLNLAEANVTQAAVETQIALDALRTRLTSEFNAALGRREVEESSRRQVLEDKWQAEREKLLTGFNDTLKTREAEEASRRKAAEEGWYAERLRLLEDVARRDDEFKRAQSDIQVLREMMDRQKTEMEAAFAREKESLETAHKSAMDQRVLRLRKEMQEREAPILKLKEQVQASENKLIESTVQAQEALETLRTKLTAEFDQVLKNRATEESARIHVLEEGWKRERLKLEQQLAERQVVVEELAERTRKAQDEAAAAASRTTAQIESLRVQLVQDFETKMQAAEKDWDTRNRQLEENWKAEVRTLEAQAQAERKRLSDALAQTQAKAIEAKDDFEVRLREMKAEWVREKEDLGAKLEEDYAQKMSSLLAACEDYRKELEATERAIEAREDRHEQGE